MTNRPFLVPKVVVETRKLEAIDQHKFFHCDIPPTSSGRAVSQKRRFGLHQGEARETLTPVVATAGRIDPDGRRQSISSSTCVEISPIGVNGREHTDARKGIARGHESALLRSGLMGGPDSLMVERKAA
jgi:hypothetical protein